MYRLILLGLFFVFLSFVVQRTYSPTLLSPTHTDPYTQKVLSDITQYNYFIWSQQLCDSANDRLPEIKTNWSHEGFYIERWDMSFNEIGENLSRDFDAPQVVPAWLNSASHKANLDYGYTHHCLVCEDTYCVHHMGKL